jgi:hypothetical protein
MSKNITQATLNNGTVITFNHNSVSGYKSACYSPIWTDVNNRDKSFIAVVSRDVAERLDSRVKEFLNGGRVLHIGTFNDPREAAYAAAHFLDNIRDYMDKWDGDRRQIGVFRFPADLYDLPTFTMSEIHSRWESLKHATKARVLVTKALKQSLIKCDTRPIKDTFYDIYSTSSGYQTLMALRSKYGTATVKRDWDNLQVTEFQLRYGL